jgi:hypothetical protein
LICCGAVGAMTGSALADVVRLKGGGEVRGKLLDPDSGRDGAVIQTQSGALVAISPTEIDFVHRRPPLLEDYVTLSRQCEETVAAHLELADWCRVQQMPEQRREQLERVLDLDPDHADARRILGYVRHLGRWMTKDDQMAERGYLRHEGRWVTRQELELIEQHSAQHEAEQSWLARVRLWLTWTASPDPQKQGQGISEFQKVRDPVAVSALTQLLSNHGDANVRTLFVKTLGKIDGARPVGPLVDRLLLDADFHIRQDALLALSPARYGQALPLLIQALRHKSNAVVCRAAEALAEIGDPRAVPALIDALVTTHTYQVQVPANNAISFSHGGGALDPRLFSGTMPAETEIMARTGQLPYGGPIIFQEPSVPRPMKTVTVSTETKNLPVLAALEKLTGRNLGFNERDWHVWWAIEKG